jgi:hypothetical protein
LPNSSAEIEGLAITGECFSGCGIEVAKFVHMKQKNAAIGGFAKRFLLFGIFLIYSCLTPGQTTLKPPELSPADKQAVAEFESRVKDYVKLRNAVKDKLPKLSKDSTAEQLEAYRKSFEEAVRVARSGAKRGDIFNTAGSDYIRRTLKTELDRKDKTELRKIVFEAENKDIPLRVNYPYPESKELTEMPPTLLLKLPQLPKEVKYRFVGRNMLLVDRDNNLIIDYMVDTLP